MDTTTRLLRRFTFALLLAAGMSLGPRSPLAAAQRLCEDDAGSSCEDDAGAQGPNVDAGASPSVDGGAAFAGAGGGEAPAVACSCEADLSHGDDRIHVCTESRERDVCRRFDCERGSVRSRTCTTRGLALCCRMPSRDLTSFLYDDCTHPNCESGFREQCRAFSGRIGSGDACLHPEIDGEDVRSDDDEPSGFCSVVRVDGRHRGGAFAWVMALFAAGFLRARRLRGDRRPR